MSLHTADPTIESAATAVPTGPRPSQLVTPVEATQDPALVSDAERLRADRLVQHSSQVGAGPVLTEDPRAPMSERITADGLAQPSSVRGAVGTDDATAPLSERITADGLTQPVSVAGFAGRRDPMLTTAERIRSDGI